MDLDGISALNLFSRFAGPRPIVDAQRKEFIEKLPSLKEDDLSALDQKDSSCPICFTPFLAILASEEMASAMESPALSVDDLGVTRLADTCGHVFCRKDIATWIQQHDTCPTCRRPFITRGTLASSAGPAQNNDGGYPVFYGLDSDLGWIPAELIEGEMFEQWQNALRSGVIAPDGTPDGQVQRSPQDEANEGSRHEFVAMYS